MFSSCLTNTDDTDYYDRKFSCICSEEYRQQKAENRRIEKILKKDKYRLRREIKILLLGTGESGKSTVMKQMKIIHGEDLTKGQELDEIRHIVYYNIIKGIKVLIDARQKLNIAWQDERLQQSADFVFRAETTNQITFEYFSRYTTLIDAIWKDQGIQQTFMKRNQFQLSDGLPYLFKHLSRISTESYIPSNQDLLHARVPTRTVLEYTVNYKDICFHFIDVGGQRKQRKKWLQCFDNMLTSILFIVSSIEYDQYLVEDSTVNRLEETLTVFELIINSNFFHEASIILFLNKTDLLAEKLKNLKKSTKQSDSYKPIGLGEVFPQFKGNPTDLKQVQSFLYSLFECRRKNRMLYSHFTTAVDTENIKRVFNDVRETVLRENIKSIINLE